MFGEMFIVNFFSGFFFIYVKEVLGFWVGYMIGWFYWFFWVIVIVVEVIVGVNII